MAQTGRHAFITGGGSGIGLAIARALAGTGWQTTLAARDERRLREAAASLERAHFQTVDVTDADATQAAIAAAKAARGPIDLLINNAGSVKSAPFEKMTLEMWRESLDLNLMGVVHCTRAVIGGMKKRGWGRVVNIASTAGLIGFSYVTPYVASKHAVVGLTKALGLEYARTGVTINAVCPGYVDTEFVSRAIRTITKASGRSEEDALANLVASNPQGRLIKPEEVAAAVLWLASDEAAAVTGIALPIAGGEVS